MQQLASEKHARKIFSGLCLPGSQYGPCQSHVNVHILSWQARQVLLLVGKWFSFSQCVGMNKEEHQVPHPCHVCQAKLVLLAQLSSRP